MAATVFPQGDPFSVPAHSVHDAARQLSQQQQSQQQQPQQMPAELAPGSLPPIQAPQVPHIPGLPGTVPPQYIALPTADDRIPQQAQSQTPQQPQAQQLTPEQQAAAIAADPSGFDAAVPDDPNALYTVGQVAEHIGTDEETFLREINIQDSNGVRTSMIDVVDAWRNAPNAVAVAAERTTLEEEFLGKNAEVGHMLDESLKRGGNLIQMLAQRLATNEYSQYEMDRMKAEEPARFNEVTARQLEDRTALQNANDQFRQESEERERTQTKFETESRQVESRKVHAFWPEYDAPATQQAVQTEVHTYLAGKGFTREQLAGLYDSKLISVIKDAIEGNRIKKRGGQAIQDARRKGLPMLQAAPQARGEAPSRQVAQEANYAQLAEQARQSGSVEDAAAAFAAR